MGGNVNLGDIDLFGGFVLSSGIPVKYKEAALVVGFLLLLKEGEI